MMKKLFTAVMAVFCIAATILLLGSIFLGTSEKTESVDSPNQTIMDGFDAFVSNALSSAKEAALAVPKVFRIEEGAPVPMPDQSCYGTAGNPAELQWLLDEAQELLDGQSTLFSTETPVKPGTEIIYYLDDTIFAVTWQQIIDNMIYTIAEVKVAHPSQFRRYMADNDITSKNLYTTTQLSAQANAVLACSADYYRARDIGIVVYDSQIIRYSAASYMDACFVDTSGDLHLIPRGTFTSQAAAEQYIADHNISFSFAFGPILVDNGERCEPAYYGLGEANDGYPRSAICQWDDLHYMMVVTNGGGSYRNYPNIHMFAEQLEKLGVQKAYSLDGGQTGAIAMNNVLLNPTEYTAGQRRVSDMYFFATALPEK